MKQGIRIAGGLLPLLLLALVLVACEDTLDLVPPSDGVLTLTANPSGVALNPNDPNAARDPETDFLTATTTLRARVTDKTGNPLSDVAVFFSSSGGRLGTQGPPGAPPTAVLTDGNGRAVDTLTISESDAATITVSARSSSLTKDATVTKTTVPCTPPLISGGADVPITTSVLCRDVTLSGSILEPTAGAVVTTQWDCGNGEPLPPAGTSAVCCYEGGQDTGGTTYTATFTVTMNRNPPNGCTGSAIDQVAITATEAR